MNKFRIRKATFFLSLAFIFGAAGLFSYQWTQVRRQVFIFSEGSTWGNIPVAGYSLEEAQKAVENYYDSPLQLSYQGSVFQVSPLDAGLTIDLGAGVNQISSPGMAQFWNSLWDVPAEPQHLDVNLTVDEERLKTYLANEIAPRYDRAAQPSIPVADSTLFIPGSAGYQLNVNTSLEGVKQALLSPEERSATLVVDESSAFTVDPVTLTNFLKAQIQQTGFTGVAEMVAIDLKNGSAIHFTVQDNQDIPNDVSFSAASTIKIPILVSVMRRSTEPIPEDIVNLADRMMALSENPPADELMRNILGGDLAPLEVSTDMELLGLKNTFLAGFFDLGSPLLKIFSTAANSRTDINLNPDLYNQTTPGDMAALLNGVYQCAQNGTGILIDSFKNDMSSAKCQFILDELKKNRIGSLMQAGVPDGIPVAHKHGWTEESDGYLHTVSDVGIVYSPNGDFLVAIYLYQPTQLLFDPANALIARLTQVVYNAVNLDAQQNWEFGVVPFPN